MTDDRIANFESECKKVEEFLHSEFARLQTGRANALMVEHAEVEAYGQKQQLRAVAGITIEDASTIAIQPWDKAVIGDIEKSLIALDLGTTPSSDGNVIRLKLPPMTEERRKTLVKTVHQLAEEARISIRHHRHTAKDAIEKETDEDVRETLLGELQKSLEVVNKNIDDTMKAKEEEVMTI